MNIIENFPTEQRYHIEKSHLIMENGKPIHQGTLWSCIRDIRNHEASMTRAVEHSPFTIMPAPESHLGPLHYQDVTLQKPSWQLNPDGTGTSINDIQ